MKCSILYFNFSLTLNLCSSAVTTRNQLTQWRQLVSCDWSWPSHGSLIQGKFYLTINRSMITPWQEYTGVSCSYSSAPGFTETLDSSVIEVSYFSEHTSHQISLSIQRLLNRSLRSFTRHVAGIAMTSTTENEAKTLTDRKPENLKL